MKYSYKTFIYIYISYIFSLCYITDYSFESLLNIISFSVKKKIIHFPKSQRLLLVLSLPTIHSFVFFLLLYFCGYWNFSINSRESENGKFFIVSIIDLKNRKKVFLFVWIMYWGLQLNNWWQRDWGILISFHSLYLYFGWGWRIGKISKKKWGN